jgi:hypothetical protein
MRMVFGLAGLLVTLGVIVWVIIVTMPATEKAVTTVKQQKDVVRQIAGQDAQGARATDSIKLAPETSGGKLTSVLVTQVAPGGVMETHYGLKRNDSIVQMGSQGYMQDVKEMVSVESAKDSLLRSYQENQPIVVIRDEKRITLPAAGPSGAVEPNANAAQKQINDLMKKTGPQQ